MNSPNLPQQSINVTQFFAEIIAEYTEFAGSVQKVIHNLPLYTPEEISAQCKELQNERSELSALDEQMLVVVGLAAIELETEPLITDYRKAFNLAVTACDNLQQQLHLRKEELILSPPPWPHPSLDLVGFVSLFF